jgi:hypothetical protein
MDLLIELGMGTFQSSSPNSDLAPLTTDSLIKSSWKFLNDQELQLQHDITFPPPRRGDKEIMSIFYKQKSPKSTCRSLITADYTSRHTFSLMYQMEQGIHHK